MLANCMDEMPVKVEIAINCTCNLFSGYGIISKRNYFVIKRRKKVYTKTLVYDGGKC